MKKFLFAHIKLTPAQIVLIYLLLGTLWILLSDQLLVKFVKDSDTLSLLQTYKGWFYVLITGGLLFGLIRSGVRRTQKIEAAKLAYIKRYDELVENAIDCIFTLDSEGNFTSVNLAVEKLTGYSREEILNLKFSDILAPENADYLSKLLDPQNTDNPTAINEVKIIGKNGQTSLLEISSRPLSLKDNRKSIENIARDVTQRRLMQKELQTAKQKYENLFETANEGIWTVDKDFKVTLVNAKFCEIIGFPAEELIGKSLIDFFDEVLIKDKTKSEILLSKNRKGSVDFLFTRPDGKLIWLLVSFSPISDHGEFQGLLYMAADITERKNAENMLRESEERFRVLFEQSPIGGMIIDKNASIIDCNESASKMLGYTQDELKQLRIMDFEVVLKEEEILAIHEKSSSAFGNFQFETKHRTKSGAIKNVLVTTTNLQIDGKEFGYASFLDITERKNAVEALSKSESRLQKLYQIISNSELNSKDRIKQLLQLGVDEFAIENAFLGEIKGNNYRVVEVVSVSDFISVGFVCNLGNTFCEEVLKRNDLVVIDDAANTSWVEHPAHKILGTQVYLGIPVEVSGKPYGTLCFSSNSPLKTSFTKGDYEFLRLMAQWVNAELTRQNAEEALRLSEEQLLQSQKLESVGRLAGGIAHDFNNMLTAINGYSDLTLNQIGKNDRFRHNIVEIKKAGERSAALTQQLLAFSRKQILKPEIVNINQIVSDISALLGRLIGEDISFIKILDFDVNPIEVDPGQLSQVIVNLAVNARDAMPKGGSLTIETKNVQYDEKTAKKIFGGKAGEYVFISVSDTGIGMTKEIKSRIFEPFFTTKGVGEGTGLGLATIYGFIKQSEGYITVDSKLGEGSTFKIYLPCVKENIVSDKKESAKVKSKVGAETILLVEDEAIVRKLSKDILLSCGYQVVEASNGLEALELCEKENLQIDLLLTDIVMPQMNGYELWESLNSKIKNLKVLFTSGYTGDMIFRRGLKDEENNFLQKPFSIEALTRKIREILDEDAIKI
ncbi:MAG: PAS domain S-box protein [Pyrinomonadaceae bacterium]|nr:PAS domain S-box protein [Pyrinomonadaceae bacterium]